MNRSTPPLALALCTALALTAAGCKERQFYTLPDAASDGPAPLPDTSIVGPNRSDGPEGNKDGCVTVTCQTASGRYCGKIGDGCGGSLECGGCPTGQVCGGGGTNQVCAAVDPGCVPKTCDQLGGRYCGKIGDGCGRSLDCGGCPTGETCSAVIPNVCGKAGPCQPLSCNQAGGKLCGVIGDGCGKSLDCGGCDGTLTCGGGGTPHVCGGPMPGCMTTGCDVSNGRFCGSIGDSCGGAVDCGQCTASGTSCGGTGTPGVCGKTPDPTCVPMSCQQPGGNYCGKVGDKCGRTIDCGACPAGQTCGPNNICTSPLGCIALTCQQAGGRYCGKIGDSCGHTLDCLECPAGSMCGADGVPGVCGKTGTCTPVECQQPTGKYCGVIGDQCGKTKDCGGCPAGQTCGGGGTPGVCGTTEIG
jgi:hypothetical protein